MLWSLWAIKNGHNSAGVRIEIECCEQTGNMAIFSDAQERDIDW
jgi:hypothetical protein